MIRAEVTVNPSRVLGEIDPLFFGQYVESLDPPARPIYGGVCDDNGRLRDDVICDLQEMQVPVIRWGGNYMDIYHWQDGIGPREMRPNYYNYQWGDGYESNQFGTHEFLELCERLHAVPYININLGTGTLQEALSWVEYCNFNGDTVFTRQRGQNGRAEPWRVPIWGVGNESWGVWEGSFSTPEIYAERYNRFTHFLRSFDPSLKFVAVGWVHDEWNRVVLQKIMHPADYFSIHMYGHSHIDTDNNYERLVGTPVFFEKFIVPRVAEDIRRYGRSPMGIVVDEWNVRHFYNGKINRASPRRMEDAIFSAGFLNGLMRNADVVKMTNQVCMVNSLAPLIATPTGTVRTPLYEVFKLYQKLCHPRVVPAQVVSPTFHCVPTPCTTFTSLATGYEADYLDVTATTNANGDRTTLALVNRHSQHAMRVSIRLPFQKEPKSAGLCLVCADSPDASQSTVTYTTPALLGEIELPAHSFGFYMLEN